MDEKGIDAQGLAPLEAELDRIAQLSDKSQLAAADRAPAPHRRGDRCSNSAAGRTSRIPPRWWRSSIRAASGLPDRDYYLKDDPKSVEMRQKYLAHVQRMFELAGRSPETAKANAATVMRIETALAKGSLDRVSRRDPEKIYHPMKKADLAALAPSFQWEQYFTGHAGAGLPGDRGVLARLLQGDRPADPEDAAGRLEDLPRLAPAALGSAAAADGLPQGELRFLRQDADRRQGNAPALEALRAISPTTSWARRWARSTSRRPSAPRARSAR